jgi:simple sugar transport system ATP-binding protein
VSATASLLRATDIRKSFGPVAALSGVSLCVDPGRVTCLLGDNGAGKSTLIKILSGLFAPDSGEIQVGGKPVTLKSPRDALNLGIATVYQDLAMIPSMAIYRNFFLGREPEIGWGLLRRMDKKRARAIASAEIEKIGVDVGDIERSVMTLSGGERQSVAIARAIYFGAKILILDEPTSSLGLKEAAVVLGCINRAKEHNIGVVLVTHNANHAFLLGDSFEILRRGNVSITFHKGELTRDQLMTQMTGDEDLSLLGRDLRHLS